MRSRLWSIVRGLLPAALVLALVCGACPMLPMAAMQCHRMSSNAPPAGVFDDTLTRDLTAHFQETHGQNVAVTWELLRKGATQSGTGPPWYYAWVSVRESGVVVDEGAVRLGAIDGSFWVTHFVPRAQIGSDPGQVEMFFPSALVPKILERAR